MSTLLEIANDTIRKPWGANAPYDPATGYGVTVHFMDAETDRDHAILSIYGEDAQRKELPGVPEGPDHDPIVYEVRDLAKRLRAAGIVNFDSSAQVYSQRR